MKKVTEKAKLIKLLKRWPTVTYHVFYRRSGAAVIGSLPKKLRSRVVVINHGDFRYEYARPLF